MESYKVLAKAFNSLKSDVDKWKWVIGHQHFGITVLCDNDDTCACFDEDHNDEPEVLQFNGYIGWSDGVFDLLEAIGIKVESV